MSTVPKKKVTEISNGGLKNHTRHEYRELSCVAGGFAKAGDTKKLYTTLYCAVCGGTKEIVAATNISQSETPTEDTADATAKV
jgi:hypothetical protein